MNMPVTKEWLRKTQAPDGPLMTLTKGDEERAIMELVHMKYLAERLGKHGATWRLGERTPRYGAVLTQGVLLPDGSQVLLHFDYTALLKCGAGATTSAQGREDGPVFEIGGGDGMSPDHPIKIRITDKTKARNAFMEICGIIPEVAGVVEGMSAIDGLQKDGRDAADAMMGGLLGETIKMLYLEKTYGPKTEWTLGMRAYYEGHVQSQMLVLRDGRAITLYFDFSGCD